MNEDIFSFDLSAGNARSEVIPNIIPAFNAGHGDLATLAVPEPTGIGALVCLTAGFVLRRRRRS